MGKCLCKDKRKEKKLIQQSSVDESKVLQMMEMLKNSEIADPKPLEGFFLQTPETIDNTSKNKDEHIICIKKVELGNFKDPEQLYNSIR